MMLRKSTAFPLLRVLCLSAAGLLPLQAAAISVSDMSAWSAPGKPLRMDIVIDDLLAARADDVQVRIASADDHGRLGLQRPAWADSVRFQVLALPDGRVVARATSSQPVNESQVSFLVDIRALSQGRLQQVGSRLSGRAIAPEAPPAAMQVGGSSYQYVPSRRSAAERRAEAAEATETRAAAEAPATVAPAPQARPYDAGARAAAQPAAPQPASKPAAPKPAAPAPAPVASKPAPAPVAVPAAKPAVVSAAPAAAAAAESEDDTLTAIHQERAVLQQQIKDAEAQIADLRSRLGSLDEREQAIQQAQADAAPVVDAAVEGVDEVADAVAVDPETGPEAAVESEEVVAEVPAGEAAPGAITGHGLVTLVMLVIIAIILLAMFLFGKLKARKAGIRLPKEPTLGAGATAGEGEETLQSRRPPSNW